MIPEAVAAMLACARIGAIHSVIFGGFSSQAVAGRIEDSTAKVIITADEAKRAGKRVTLKKIVDDAIDIVEAGSADDVPGVLVVENTGCENVRSGFVEGGMCGIMKQGGSWRQNVPLSLWGRRSRCLFCTRVDLQVNPKVYCTQLAVISYQHR